MANESEKLLGELRPEEMALIMNLREQANNIVFEIGQSEVRKNRMMASLYETEERGRKVLAGVGQRLEIPPNSTWKVVDGKAILVQPVQMPQPVVPANGSAQPQQPPGE